MSTAPHSLAAPLEEKEKTPWIETSDKTCTFIPYCLCLRLHFFTPAVLPLTCDFDFLHDLAGSVVDFHADSDWFSVVINLNLRKIY